MARRIATVELDEGSAAFLDAQLSQGRFHDAGAVLQAGLRRLEEDEKRLETLRALIAEGEASGVSDRTLDDIWDEALEQHRARNG